MHRPLSLGRKKSALVLIDLQEEHRKDDRFLVAGLDGVLGNAARLLNTARAAGWPVVHAAYIRDFNEAPRRPFEPVQADGTPFFSVPGDWTGICPEVAPRADEVVVHKNDASCFTNSEFQRVLAAQNVEWIVVTGVWTEACVAATVRDAASNGFRVLLVKDACGSGTRAMHRSAVIHTANRIYGGGVTDTATACALMQGETKDVWQLVGSTPLRFDVENMDEVYASL